MERRDPRRLLADAAGSVNGTFRTPTPTCHEPVGQAHGRRRERPFRLREIARRRLLDAPRSGASGIRPRAHPQPGGEVKQLSREQFEAMALVDRIRLPVRGTLRFFRGEEELSSVEPLKSAHRPARYRSAPRPGLAVRASRRPSTARATLR